jgi:signal transduction histidine kinase
LHLLPDHLEDPEFQGEFRSVVLDELQRMERLLDTLLEHARPVSNRVPSEPLHAAANLERVLASLLRLLEQRAAERGVRILSEIDVAVDDIAIGEDALRQILLNLILNALEAAPAESTVTLRASLLDQNVEFSVEDEGSGVSEALRGRLFEPFFSTREDRAGGLGLAITKKLIEDAGGEIRVAGASNGGARFCVTLPRSGVAAQRECSG